MANNCAEAAFNDKAVRWLINSFINDIDINKKQYDIAVSQLKYRHIFKTEVLPLLLEGTRLVAFDYDGLCNNCYHYGPWNSAGSEHGFCMNHLGWHRTKYEKRWMTFEQYRSTSRFSKHFSSYKEYKIECEIEFRSKELHYEKTGWYW